MEPSFYSVGGLPVGLEEEPKRRAGLGGLALAVGCGMQPVWRGLLAEVAANASAPQHVRTAGAKCGPGAGRQRFYAMVAVGISRSSFDLEVTVQCRICSVELADT